MKSTPSKPKAWICPICGYIHYGDEAADKCPVCGADKASFEQMQIDDTVAVSAIESGDRIIIVGAGSAGDSAAENARRATDI